MTDPSDLAAAPTLAWRRWILPMILVLALLRGGMYASLMPPWGLIDEEHHVDYIHHLAERGQIPVVGQTYLSPAIVDSLFATRRWEVFHWLTPESRDPTTMGLEGHSYEGYQPPLFYLLLAPVYRLLPGDVLTKVFALRWALVGLSVLTVWIAHRLTAELFPYRAGLHYAVPLLLALIPERTMAVSRINNDVLLEVLAAAFVWVVARVELQGLTVRRGQLLGLLLGLGLLTKLSMALLAILLLITLWNNRGAARWHRCMLWAMGLAFILIVPLLVRNLWLYGDITGFAAFAQLHSPPVRAISLPGLVQAAADLFRHFWVVWWKGAEVGRNPLLNVLYAMLALLTGFGGLSLSRYLWNQIRRRQWDARDRVIAAYLIVMAVYAVAVIASYMNGHVPVIQGRLLLPVVVPITIVLSWALWSSGPLGQLAFLGALALLVLVDVLSLFVNQLPYFYYWSAFIDNGVAQPYTPLPWLQAWTLFYERLRMDKPVGLQAVLVWVPLLYMLWLIFTTAVIARSRLAPLARDPASAQLAPSL